MTTDYLRRILGARVYEVAHETPLERAPGLSQRLGCEVLLKREDTQPVFSFKVRGAYNKMAHLTTEQLQKGVIAASAGNHAQGVALSAKALGCRAVIVMPITTPSVKIDAVRARGAEVVLAGDSYSDAYAHALSLQSAQGLTFVHPFDDPDVIAGQGTIGMEILRQHADPIDAIFIAVGGGGLIAGVGALVKELRPETLIIGVQTEDSDAMAQSLEQGERVQLHDVGLFSDGTAVKQVGEETFRIAQKVVDRMIRVDTDAVCAAIKDIYQDTRAIEEPAGALALAGLKAYVETHGSLRADGTPKTLVAIACGANMNFDRLRFVSERSEIGEQREAIFAVTIPEERGSFKRFCGLLGSHSVTEFNYRIADAHQAHLFLGLQVKDRAEAQSIAKRLVGEGFATLDLSADETAKNHIRHMVGGRSPLAKDERLFRFEFPERPGALLRFLSAMNPSWNISLFHYRNHGSDTGNILVGLQVPGEDAASFDAFLIGLGYPHWEETQHPAYQLFLN
ncbi:MAG: threonine ammonia-lyase, biosynthetic [Pseudomonadota bacterium]